MDETLRASIIAVRSKLYCEFTLKSNVAEMDLGPSGGADGRDTAEKLVRIVRGGEGSRGKLEQLLAGQRPGLMADDMGTPAFDESS